MKKIGIMGGTFDPIHNGHIMLGEQAYREYHLDEVWYMPSRQPPHKSGRPVTESSERCRMVQLAIQSIPYFLYSDFEIRRREGNTYTAETLKLLGEAYPETEFYFIIGADSLYDIEKWYHPADVMRQAVLLVAHREYSDARCTLENHADYLRSTYGARIAFLHCPEVHIASEEIRRLAGGHKLPEHLLPEAVARYIKDHKLYE